jgi:hypothetical protein
VQGQFQHVVRDRFVGVGDGVGEAAGDFLQARHFIRGVAAALGQAVLVAGVLAAGLLSFRMAFRKTFLARAFADRFDFLEGRQRDGRRDRAQAALPALAAAQRAPGPPAPFAPPRAGPRRSGARRRRRSSPSAGMRFEILST